MRNLHIQFLYLQHFHNLIGIIITYEVRVGMYEYYAGYNCFRNYFYKLFKFLNWAR